MHSSSRQRYYIKLANEDSGAIAPEQDCHQDNCPRIIVSWMIACQIIAPEHNFTRRKLLPPWNNCLLDNCPKWIITRGKLFPRKFPPHHKISRKNNCPHSSKFLSKSTTSTIIKESFYQKLFERLKIRCKKWFPSIYLFQILTKSCRTP